MKTLRSIRLLSSVGVTLVLLLLLEVPALAYPGTPARPRAEVAATAPQLGTGLLDHGVPRLASVQLRRAAATPSATELREPTLPEGAVFTVLGAGFICGGAITLGVGLAQFIPIVTASGLIETTLGPLILAGLGFTMLVVGIPFLIHGILVLTQVRAAEKAVEAPTALVIESPWDTRPGPRRTVLLRF